MAQLCGRQCAQGGCGNGASASPVMLHSGFAPTCRRAMALQGAVQAAGLWCRLCVGYRAAGVIII